MSSEDKLTVRDRAFLALKEILISKKFSHLVLKDIADGLENPRDRRLLWEITLGVVRWLLRIDYGLSRQIKRYKKLPEEVKICLRLGYYQLLFMDRIPPYSAVSETVEVAKKFLPLKFHKFTNAVLRKALKLPFPVPEEDDPVFYASIAKSHPEWMVRRWKERFGAKELTQLLNANNQAAPFTVWVNTFYTTFSAVRKELKSMGIECKPFPKLPDEMLQILSPKDLIETDLYKEGLINPQDVASYLVVKALDPKPEEIVLDACAAPGIKTSQIALHMENRGRIIACEISEERFKLLEENIQRMGAHIVESVNADVVEYVKEFKDAFFDRILVDAPCSDLGTIRRRPELKWKREKKDVELCAEKQKEILSAVIPKLKRGGILVYSVCTFEKEETEDVIKEISEKHGLEPVDFSDLMPEAFREKAKGGVVTLLPHITGSDGFFIAKLRRR